MLLVKTFIGPSRIHGIGLFSGEEIKKGTPIWQYHPTTTQIFSKLEYLRLAQELTLPSLIDFIHFSYVKQNKIYYLNDNSRYINHYEHTNIAFMGPHSMISTKTIKRGEELLESYTDSYDADDFFHLNFSDRDEKEQILEKICQLLTINSVERVS